jgi:hypothetical protein
MGDISGAIVMTTSIQIGIDIGGTKISTPKFRLDRKLARVKSLPPPMLKPRSIDLSRH